jgi:putative hydrolase of the HAD superfamily
MTAAQAHESRRDGQVSLATRIFRLDRSCSSTRPAGCKHATHGPKHTPTARRDSVSHRALLVDALGTLVRLEPPAPILRRLLAGRCGIVLSQDEANRGIAAEIAYYRGHLDEGRDERSLARLRRRAADALRGALPALADVDGDTLTKILLASIRFSAFPDAPGALEAARARELQVVVASNWDVSLHELLARLQLAPLLDGIVTSAEVGASKPSPEVFERALQLAGVASDDAIHVGDSVEHDVIGAQNAGIEPILLSRDGRVAPPGVRSIASLAELERTLI